MRQIIIHQEIPSQNATGRGRTWRVRAASTKKIRSQWRCACRYAMAISGVSQATGKRALKITAYRKQRCRDIANLIGGAKACIDGMVDAGLLLDDADSKASISYAQEVASKSPTGEPCTVIEVEDI